METTNDPQKIGVALGWIVDLLNRYQVPYQIVGGLAAKAYGATRPLVDIDLYVPLEQAQEALKEMQPYIVREPLPHLSLSWDLVYLALSYQEMYMEIGDATANPRFFNRRDQRWETQDIQFERSQVLELYGVTVNVMPKAELLAYKAMLEREVDHQDMQEISANGS